MKKKTTYLIITFIVFYTTVSLGQKYKTDRGELKKIRNLEFGMNINQVMNLEKADFLDEKQVDGEEVLQYATQLYGLDCNLIYSFVDNKMLSCLIIFNQDYEIDESSYLDNYFNVYSKLEEIHGSPDYENQVPSDSTFKNDVIESLIKAKKLEMTSIWQYDNARVISVYIRDNNKITNLIGYVANEYREPIKKVIN